MIPKIYLTCDHAGFELKNKLIKEMSEVNFADLSRQYDGDDDYPVFASELATRLKPQPESFAIAICGTGQGIAMALNRFAHVRAGIGYDPEIVKLIRLHNQANVLCLPAVFLTVEKAVELVNIFLSTKPDSSERHQRRINMFS